MAKMHLNVTEDYIKSLARMCYQQDGSTIVKAFGASRNETI